MYYQGLTHHINIAGLGKLRLITAPATEPVTLAELKEYLRIDGDAEDTRLTALITAARMWAETVTRRQFITATWAYYLDYFTAYRIELPLPDLQAITSIQYVDLSGATQTLSTAVYDVDNKAAVGAIVEAEGQTWPSTDDTVNAVTITYTAGYGDDASDVPETVRQAIIMKAGLLYEDCGDSNVENTCKHLLGTEIMPEVY